MNMNMTDHEMQLFLKAMEEQDKTYDPVIRMNTEYRGINGYHSQLSDCTVHAVHRSICYAYMLLCRNAEGDCQRAHDIIYKLLPMQDINPNRPTYGVWPYFHEEDIAQMAPADWNWADFNAKILLKMMFDHLDKLTDDLVRRMEDAVVHACRAIIKRDVQPNYTNISIMGSFVTLAAGMRLNNKDFFEYGKQRLKKLHDYNVKNGSFSEFNSPTYTFVAIRELTSITDYIQDEDCVGWVNTLLDMAWYTVAVHYHPTTGQLTGPHFRAYSYLIGAGTKFLIERGTNYRVILLSDKERLAAAESFGYDTLFPRISCPDHLLPYFLDCSEERLLDQTFAPGKRAYTYVHPQYTIGSLRSEFGWNQHRNVIGYLGTTTQPVCINIQALHDDWDYCSSIISTVQDKGTLATTVGFVTSGCDTHIVIDPIKDGTIEADDLRVRCLLFGAIETLKTEQIDERTLSVTTKDGVTLRITCPYAAFDGKEILPQITQQTTERVMGGHKEVNGSIAFDLVLYHGERRAIDFRALQNTAASFVVQFVTDDTALQSVHAEATEDALTVTTDTLKISSPIKPMHHHQYFPKCHTWRDGEELRPAY